MKKLLFLCLVLACGTNLFDIVDNAGKGAISLLKPSHGVLEPGFSPAIHSYKLQKIGSSVEAVAFTAHSYITGSQIIYASGGSVCTNLPGEQSMPFPLASGRYTDFSVQLLKLDGTSVNYTITAYRPGPADLRNLTVEGHVLEPAFDPQTMEYSIKVPALGGTLRVIAEHEAGSSVTINGVTGYDQVLTIPAALPWTINISVTASGVTKVYKILVGLDSGGTTVKSARLSTIWSTEAMLDPAFSPETADYTLTFPSFPSTIGICAQPEDGAATVTINGTAYSPGTSYHTSLMDGLAPGDSGQVYTVMVTSSDGLATKSYSVVVRKAKTHPVGITIGALEGPTVPFTFSPGVSTYNVVLNTFNTNVMINVTKLDDQFVKINGSEAGGINMFFPGSGTQSATIETTHWLYSGTCTITITKP